jgi:hypothetical protein
MDEAALSYPITVETFRKEDAEENIQDELRQ